MTVDTFDSPLHSIDFPAITLCTSDEFQPDNWALTEKVFNLFDFNCKYGDDSCDQIRKDFKPFLKIIFDKLYEKLEKLDFNPMVLEKMWLETSGLTLLDIDHLCWAMDAYKLDLMMIDEVIIESIGRKDVTIKDLHDMLPKEYNGTNDCNTIHSGLKEAILMRFIAADFFIDLSVLKLGTLLRQYSDQIGYSFQNVLIDAYSHNDWSSNCNNFGEVENLIFETMKRIATQFGLKASLHDIPNIFSNGYNKYFGVQFYPLYSICNADNLLFFVLVCKLFFPI